MEHLNCVSTFSFCFLILLSVVSASLKVILVSTSQVCPYRMSHRAGYIHFSISGLIVFHSWFPVNIFPQKKFLPHEAQLIGNKFPAKVWGKQIFFIGPVIIFLQQTTSTNILQGWPCLTVHSPRESSVFHRWKLVISSGYCLGART